VFLNAWHLRLGAIGACVVLALAWMARGGSVFPGSDCKVLIEFGSDPEFAGLHVEVDGQDAGPLERIGAMTRTAFPVSCGTHRVRVLHPEYDPADLQVEAKIPGVATMLLLEHADAPPDGKPALTLRP
jgi:hypothetical protein